MCSGNPTVRAVRNLRLCQTHNGLKFIVSVCVVTPSVGDVLQVR